MFLWSHRCIHRQEWLVKRLRFFPAFLFFYFPPALIPPTPSISQGLGLSSEYTEMNEPVAAEP